MPLQPPGNRLFFAYVDGNLKWKSTYIGPDPITCLCCQRETYVTRSGLCAWCKGILGYQLVDLILAPAAA